MKEQGLLPSSDEEEEEPKPEPEEQAAEAEAQEVVAESLDQAQLVALNPTAAAIMAAAQPQLGALTAIPQPVASPSALTQPVAVPISIAGMMLQPTPGTQILQATPGSQPMGIPQAGAPVVVASQSSLAAALAGQPQPIFSASTGFPPGTSLIPGLSPFGRPVLVRQATPGLQTAASLAGLRAIPTSALTGQPQLVAHPGLPTGLHPGLPGLGAVGTMPTGMLGGMAGLQGATTGLPPVMVGPPVLLPSRLARPM